MFVSRSQPLQIFFQYFLFNFFAESVTERILERDFKRVALGVKRQRVEEGLEGDIPADISDVALKVIRLKIFGLRYGKRPLMA